MRLIIIFVLLLIQCFSISSGEEEHIKNWQHSVLLAFEFFNHPRYIERLKGIELLESLPVEANSLIIQQLEKEAGQSLLLGIISLTNRNVPQVPDLIIQHLEKFDFSAKDLIVQCLVKYEESAYFKLTKALMTRNFHLEVLINAFLDQIINQQFKIVYQNYQRGYFASIFKPIWYTELAGFTRIKAILLGKSTAFTDEVARELAARALIDWPLPADFHRVMLQQAVDQVADIPGFFWLPTSISEQLYCGLYRLKSTELLNPVVESEKNLLSFELYSKDWDAAIEQLQKIGKLSATAWLSKQAIESFEQAIQIFLKHKTLDSTKKNLIEIYLELAEMYLKEDKINKALEALKNAYKLGFLDFEWLFLDQDLANLWKTSQWKEWIEELKTNNLNKELIPSWEPGRLLK